MLTVTGSDALLDLDPDLGAALSPEEFAAARAAIRAPLVRFDETDVRGKWGQGSGHLAGLLIVEGALLREVQTARRVTAEVVGPGDVIRPFQEDGEEDLPVRAEISWRSIKPPTLAIIDARIMTAATRWPSVPAAIVARAVRRTQRLSVNLSISHMVRIADRLLLLFWHLATHWGRVTPNGVVIDLPLTHTQLALLVGSERPSVTTALGKLDREGLVRRLEDRCWLLEGHVPDDLGELVARGLHGNQALPRR